MDSCNIGVGTLARNTSTCHQGVTLNESLLCGLLLPHTKNNVDLAVCTSFYHFMGNRWGESGSSVRLLFWPPKSLQMVIAAVKLKDAYSLEGKL